MYRRKIICGNKEEKKFELKIGEHLGSDSVDNQMTSQQTSKCETIWTLDEFGNSPLHNACLKRNIESVRALIASFNANEGDIRVYINLPDRNGWSALHFACKGGDSEMISLLITHGADKKATNIDNDNPLHIACRRNKKKAVQALITSFDGNKRKIKQYVNLPGKNCFSGLHIACRVGGLEIINLLIAHGADREAMIPDRGNPLHTACRRDKIEAVQALITSFNGDERKIREYVNLLSPFGWSALYYSCQKGSSEIISLLLAHGADKKAKNTEQDNPLHIACFYNKIEAVQALIKSFNDNEREIREYVNLPGLNEWCALHCICGVGNSEIINLLIVHGACRKATNAEQDNPLHIACYNKKIDAVQALITSFNGNEMAIREYVNSPGQDGWSALHFACKMGNSEIIKLLLAHGAEREAKNTNQDNPLHIACKWNKIEAAEVLITSFNENEIAIREYINLPGQDGWSALHIASKEGDSEIIKLLLAHGVEREAKNTHQNNPLHIACKWNKIEAAEVLITSFNKNEMAIREYINLPGQDKWSALHFACKKGDSEIIKLLIAHGAEREAKNAYQDNSLHIACKWNHIEAVGVLITSFNENEIAIREYVNLPGQGGWSVFHFACKEGHSEIIKILIAHGAEREAKSMDQDNPLHIACKWNNIEAIGVLITSFNGNEKAVSEYVNLPGQDGWSALHIASKEGDLEIIKLLIALGADRKAKNTDHDNPLHIACKWNKIKSVRALIASFKKNKVEGKEYVNLPGYNGMSSLHSACLYGGLEIINLILAHGADRIAKDTDQNNPLHVACKCNKYEAVRALITSISGNDREIRKYLCLTGEHGFSALHFSCQKGGLEVINLLLAFESDRRAMSDAQNNPLHIACEYNQIEAVQVLINSFIDNEREIRRYVNLPGQDKWFALHCACRVGGSEIINLLLSHGADIKAKNTCRETPLYVACYNKKIEAVRALITSFNDNESEIREYVNCCSKGGWSALHCVCRERDSEIISLLISHGADRIAKNKYQNTPLHIACYNNRIEAVRTLISSFNENKEEIKEFVNLPSQDGWSALHIACKDGDSEIISLLLAHGADRKAKNAHQENPLHTACYNNKMEAVRILISSFNENKEEIKEFVNLPSQDGWSALHLACKNGDSEIVSHLLSHGADRKAKNTYQNNPLHNACYSNKIEAVRALITSFNANKREIRKFVNLRNQYGWSALHFACKNGDLEIVSLLIAHGANRNAKSRYQKNPLHVACEWNNIEAVRALITSFKGNEREIREYINFPSGNGWCALHCASKEGDFEIINFLLVHGADRNAKNRNQDNPLHIMCRWNNIEAVRALIKSFNRNKKEIREYVNLPGHDGWSALHFVCKERDSDIIFLLISHGAERKAKNTDQDNPLHIACHYNNIEVVRALITSFNGKERKIRAYVNLSGRNGFSPLHYSRLVGNSEIVDLLLKHGGEK